MAAPTISRICALIVTPPTSNMAREIGSVRKPSGPKNSSARPEMAKCTATATISSTSTEASASGRNAMRSSSGATGRISAKRQQHLQAERQLRCRRSQRPARPAAAAARRSRAARPARARACPARHSEASSISHGDGRQHRDEPHRARAGGPIWIEASVSAVNAAMSPNGTKMTRVTEKISTVPSAIST